MLTFIQLFILYDFLKDSSISGIEIKQQKERTLTDVVDGTSAELSIELLGPESPEVMNGVGPEVEHIVPGESVPLLDHHHFAAEQGQLDGRSQTAGAATDDQTLGVTEGMK